MSWNNSYPFGLHGYHRPQGKTGKIDWGKPLSLNPLEAFGDPLNVFGSTYDPSYKGRMAAEEEERRKDAVRERINKLYGIGDDSARAAMEEENTKLGEATRQYYADQLGDNYAEAERKTRFKLARQGLLGGSEGVNQQGDVKQDRDLGATRVNEAVSRAIANLTSQREQERLNSINLVNAGHGDNAVAAASSGLRSSLENVSNQQKADLFGDLFTGAADAGTASNMANNQALLASAYWRNRPGWATFFNPKSTSGSVTAS